MLAKYSRPSSITNLTAKHWSRACLGWRFRVDTKSSLCRISMTWDHSFGSLDLHVYCICDLLVFPSQTWNLVEMFSSNSQSPLLRSPDLSIVPRALARLVHHRFHIVSQCDSVDRSFGWEESGFILGSTCTAIDFGHSEFHGFILFFRYCNVTSEHFIIICIEVCQERNQQMMSKRWAYKRRPYSI